MLSCRNARCGDLHIMLWARTVEPAYLSYFFHVWTMGSVACFGGMVFGIAGPGPSSQQSPEASRTSASLHRSHTACCQGGSFHQRSAPISDRSSSPLQSQLLEALQHDTRGGLNYPPRHPCNSAWHLLDDCSFCYSFLWRFRDARSSKSAGRSLHKRRHIKHVTIGVADSFPQTVLATIHLSLSLSLSLSVSLYLLTRSNFLITRKCPSLNSAHCDFDSMTAWVGC